MTDDYSYTEPNWKREIKIKVDTSGLSLEDYAEVIAKLREEIDLDINSRLFAASPFSGVYRPSMRIEPEEPPYEPGRLYPYPIYRSSYIPAGEAYGIAGMGIFIGEGPAAAAAHLDKFDLDIRPLGLSYLHVILGLALLLLTLLIGVF